MRRMILHTAFILMVSSPLTSQETTVVPDNPHALSFSRLSFSLSTAYFPVPWKDLNSSFGDARDAVNYSPSWQSPSGHAEKVIGDANLHARASYRIVGNFSLFLGGMYTERGAELLVRQSVGSGYVSGQFVQTLIVTDVNEFSLVVRGYVFGVEYEWMDLIPLRISVGMGRAFGQLGYLYDKNDEYTRHTYRSILNAGNRLLIGEISSSVPLVGPISLSATIAYRALTLSSMKGSGVFSFVSHFNGYSESHTFSSELIQARSYYGITTTGSGQAEVSESYILHSLWSKTPQSWDWWQARQPAVVDLSGFGFSIGLRVAL